MATTYLDLPPNMGGTQFGPFSGTIQIGSDPAKCQIVLNQQMGIAPVHVTIGEYGDGYMISPAQRGFGLFLSPGGTNAVQPIAGATAASPGDAIILGSPGGPRFTLRRVEGGGRGLGMSSAGGGGRGRGGSMGDRVARELWRQQMARLMMRNRAVRDIYQMMFRYRTGSLTNPRVIVALVGSVVAMVGAGLVSCGGIIAALRSGVLGN